MVDLSTVRADLVAEQASLDGLVAGLDPDDWDLPTPSPGWTITDQIGHLTYFDRNAALAVEDPDAFAASVEALLGAEDGDELTLGEFRRLEPGARLDAWRAGRRRLSKVAEGMSEDQRVAWYGPSMGAKSFLTARLMECWAHGTDVADTLGLGPDDPRRVPTDRLAHIARLGFNTRGWSYVNRGQTAPTTPIRVSLTAPSGDRWDYGDDDADEFVEGSALDFCLVTSQRRHLDDTNLVVSDQGREWLERAQIFAGPPTDGPTPVGS